MDTKDWIIIGLAVLLTIALIWFVCHQRKMKERAYLMREALRNRDFSFRLPLKGMPSGDKACQQLLNDMGQEIRTLMNRNEVESWQRLTRVLTHEIMNVTAPISSITQSFLDRGDVKGTPLEDGIRAIRDTSVGLTRFVESYRTMMHLQKAVPQDICLRDIVESVASLYPSLKWETDSSLDRTVYADANLVRQVLTNLAKNAVEAGAERIGLAWTGEGLAVSNDGKAIPAEIRNEIFVPFYTTKRDGSGIGLALSRQICVTQGGNLSLRERSLEGFHVTFLITFREGR